MTPMTENSSIGGWGGSSKSGKQLLQGGTKVKGRNNEVYNELKYQRIRIWKHSQDFIYILHLCWWMQFWKQNIITSCTAPCLFFLPHNNSTTCCPVLQSERTHVWGREGSKLSAYWCFLIRRFYCLVGLFVCLFVLYQELKSFPNLYLGITVFLWHKNKINVR